MDFPDITIVLSNDIEDWGDYLSDCFHQRLDPSLKIELLDVEYLSFPLPDHCVMSLDRAKVVLVILSEAFLKFIEENPRSFQFIYLLKPSQTVALMCGLKDCEVNSHYKELLVMYDLWLRLETPIIEGKMFLHNVIRTVDMILKRLTDKNQRSQELQFELCPKVIHKKSREVFAVLNVPVKEDQDIIFILEKDNKQEKVESTRRNPFTFQFSVPASFISTSSMITVCIWNSEGYYGQKTLYYQSPMAQMLELLDDNVSPYELLCQSLNVTTPVDVDHRLTQIFKANLPSEGFNLLVPPPEPLLKTEDEMPTLLHFAARYGMKEFTSVLLKSPGAASACGFENCRGLLPVHLARLRNHTETADILDSFQEKLGYEPHQTADRLSKTKDNEPNRIYYTVMQENPAHLRIYESIWNSQSLHDISQESSEISKLQHWPVTDSKQSYPTYENNSVNPPTLPQRTQSIPEDKSGHYEMMSPVFSSEESGQLPPHKKIILESLSSKRKEKESTKMNDDDYFSPVKEEPRADSPECKKCCFLSPQQELIAFNEEYKKDVSTIEAEMKFRDWQKRNSSSSGKKSSGYSRDQNSKIQSSRRRRSNSFFDLFNFIFGLFKQKGTSAVKLPDVTDGCAIYSENDILNDNNDTTLQYIRDLALMASRCGEYSNVMEPDDTSVRSSSTNTSFSTKSCRGSSGSSLKSSDRCSSVCAKDGNDNVFYSDSGEESKELKGNQLTDAENNTHSTLRTSLRHVHNPFYEYVLPRRNEVPGNEKQVCSVEHSDMLTSEDDTNNTATAKEKFHSSPSHRPKIRSLNSSYRCNTACTKYISNTFSHFDTSEEDVELREEIQKAVTSEDIENSPETFVSSLRKQSMEAKNSTLRHTHNPSYECVLLLRKEDPESEKHVFLTEYTNTLTAGDDANNASTAEQQVLNSNSHQPKTQRGSESSGRCRAICKKDRLDSVSYRSEEKEKLKDEETRISTNVSSIKTLAPEINENSVSPLRTKSSRSEKQVNNPLTSEDDTKGTLESTPSESVNRTVSHRKPDDDIPSAKSASCLQKTNTFLLNYRQDGSNVKLRPSIKATVKRNCLPVNSDPYQSSQAENLYEALGTSIFSQCSSKSVSNNYAVSDSSTTSDTTVMKKNRIVSFPHTTSETVENTKNE
ncbi:uncharacterized protein LOC111084966 [Limulus polyphemus]|uniref:Uncharacterized protein LOC111084966 n=1 Tax=Limulus polyphemus TaxID=6850 RepID=A0ABM1S185_LIMPO|nr:uncharacterized protein LOC111084966 [Limulus polyphemus]